MDVRTHVCVHVQRRVGRCASQKHQTILPASLMRTKGSREAASLSFTGLIILLSGLGGHAKDLVAVSIKMFTRRLSGLALLPSCRMILMQLLPLKHFIPASGSVGFAHGSPLAPPQTSWPGSPRGTRTSVALTDPSVCSRRLHRTDYFPGRGSRAAATSDLFRPTQEAWVCSPPKNILPPHPHP